MTRIARTDQSPGPTVTPLTYRAASGPVPPDRPVASTPHGRGLAATRAGRCARAAHGAAAPAVRARMPEQTESSPRAETGPGQRLNTESKRYYFESIRSPLRFF